MIKKIIKEYTLTCSTIKRKYTLICINDKKINKNVHRLVLMIKRSIKNIH